MATHEWSPAEVSAPRDIAAVVSIMQAANSEVTAAGFVRAPMLAFCRGAVLPPASKVIGSKHAAQGTVIKASGGCAAMSDAVATRGNLVQTYLLEREPQPFDESKRLFWFGAGTSISAAVEYLMHRSPSLAMPNLGGWTGQTVVGAVMTGTQSRNSDMFMLTCAHQIFAHV